MIGSPVVATVKKSNYHAIVPAKEPRTCFDLFNMHVTIGRNRQADEMKGLLLDQLRVEG